MRDRCSRNRLPSRFLQVAYSATTVPLLSLSLPHPSVAVILVFPLRFFPLAFLGTTVSNDLVCSGPRLLLKLLGTKCSGRETREPTLVLSRYLRSHFDYVSLVHLRDELVIRRCKDRRCTEHLFCRLHVRLKSPRARARATSLKRIARFIVLSLPGNSTDRRTLIGSHFLFLRAVYCGK